MMPTCTQCKTAIDFVLTLSESAESAIPDAKIPRVRRLWHRQHMRVTAIFLSLISTSVANATDTSPAESITHSVTPQSEDVAASVSPQPAADRALLDAARNRNLELCTFALERGANVDVRDDSDEATPALVIAARSGAGEIVSKLLNNNAAPDIATSTGITALMQAARSSSVEIAKALIDAGATLDLSDRRKGYSALHHAAENGNQQILNALLSAGANVNKIDTADGRTALMLAAHRLTGFPMVLDLLAAGADLNQSAADGWTALMAATQRKNNDVIEVLLLNGAEPEATTDDGRTALTIAAQSGAFFAMRLLTNALGEQLDLKTLGPSLHTAATNGSDKIVNHLLDLGVSPERFTESGLAVLHSAVLGGHSKVVATLLSGQADPNVLTRKEGHSALMLAANRDMPSIVKVLLGAGARVDIEAKDGWTAIQAATMIGATDIVDELLLHERKQDANK